MQTDADIHMKVNFVKKKKKYHFFLLLVSVLGNQMSTIVNLPFVKKKKFTLSLSEVFSFLVNQPTKSGVTATQKQPLHFQLGGHFGSQCDP